MKEFFILILFLTFLLTSSLAQKINSNDSLTPNQLREDFSILRNKLETLQPGLYLYTSKDTLDKRFDEMAASLNDSMTPIDFFRKISTLHNSIRNLHTSFWLSDVMEKELKTLSHFPFDIYWRRDSMFILGNNSSNENIPVGSFIKRINGVKSESIFYEIADGRRKDGFITTYPNAAVMRNFNVFYPRYLGTPSTFILDVVAPDGAEQQLTVQGLTYDEITKNRLKRSGDRYNQYTQLAGAWIDKKEPALNLVIKGETAILTVKTFYRPIIEDNGQNPEKYFDRSFDQILASKVKYLILDMRMNEGGNDLVAMALFSHLYDSTYSYYKRRTSLVKPAMKYVQKGDVYEIIGRGDLTGEFEPSKNVFKGAVYVLMNGQCVSAAAEFIGHLKNVNRATFIGEETGGNPVIFTGGANVELELPHSHIGYRIPMHQIEMNVKYKNTGRGVMPDYEVVPGIKDILELKDVEIEFVQKLIRNKN